MSADFQLDGGESSPRTLPKPMHGKCSGCSRKTTIVELGPRGRYCAVCHQKRVADWDKFASGGYKSSEGPPLW